MPNLVVASTAIGDDLDAGQCKRNVGRSGCEQLLTCLCGQNCIIEGQGSVAKRATALSSDFTDLWW